VISWGTILGGAALTVLFAAVVLVVLRERRPSVIGASLVSAFAGPIAWNAILHRVRGSEFFVDIPSNHFLSVGRTPARASSHSRLHRYSSD